MKKLPLILVAAILALILPAGVVVAKVLVNQIEFNLDDGTYEIRDTSTVSVPASVVLRGNLREKGTDMYLSPLSGTITIDGEEHSILVKAEKEPEPVNHIQNGVLDVYWQQVLVHVEGWKSTSGVLQWGTKSSGEVFSELEFWGTVDGGDVDCETTGSLPIID